MSNFGVQPYDEAKTMISAHTMLEAAEANLGVVPDQLRRVLEVTDGEWSERWETLQQCELSGPIRSFLFKLNHRRLPLFSVAWLQQHYGRSHCILCQREEKETYSHLFSECEVAEQLWQAASPMIALLQISPTADMRPMRLVGDLSHAKLGNLGNHWPNDQPRPTQDKLWRWTRVLWTEMRAAVLHPIWMARCALLAGDEITTREEAAQRASQQSTMLLRSLVYRKVPSLLEGALRPKSSSLLTFIGRRGVG